MPAHKPNQQTDRRAGTDFKRLRPNPTRPNKATSEPKQTRMITTPAAAGSRRGAVRRPPSLLLLVAVGLAALLVLLPPAAAYLCTEEPPAVRKQEGAWGVRACVMRCRVRVHVWRVDRSISISIDRPPPPPPRPQTHTNPHTITESNPTPTHTGETCGGACFSEGLCAEGLVCGPSPEDTEFLAAADENAVKIRDFVDHILGRAATGVCVKPMAGAGAVEGEEAVRELRALPAAATGAAPPCVGCPTGIDPTGEYVVEVRVYVGVVDG